MKNPKIKLTLRNINNKMYLSYRNETGKLPDVKYLLFPFDGTPVPGDYDKVRRFITDVFSNLTHQSGHLCSADRTDELGLEWKYMFTVDEEKLVTDSYVVDHVNITSHFSLPPSDYNMVGIVGAVLPDDVTMVGTMGYPLITNGLVPDIVVFGTYEAEEFGRTVGTLITVSKTDVLKYEDNVVTLSLSKDDATPGFTMVTQSLVATEPALLVALIHKYLYPSIDLITDRTVQCLYNVTTIDQE